MPPRKMPVGTIAAVGRCAQARHAATCAPLVATSRGKVRGSGDESLLTSGYASRMAARRSRCQRAGVVCAAAKAQQAPSSNIGPIKLRRAPTKAQVVVDLCVVISTEASVQKGISFLRQPPNFVGFIEDLQIPLLKPQTEVPHAHPLSGSLGEALQC